MQAEFEFGQELAVFRVDASRAFVLASASVIGRGGMFGRGDPQRSGGASLHTIREGLVVKVNADLKAIQDALDSFLQPYAIQVWFSQEHEQEGQLQLLENIMHALDSNDKEDRTRAYLATQMLLVVGLKVSWHYTITRKQTVKPR
jgi:hypothetical protein